MTGRYFKFTSNGSNKNSSNHYVEVQILDAAGTNLALNRNVEYSYRGGSSNPAYVTNGKYDDSSQYFDVGTGKAWIIIDLETPQEVSSIKIWRYYADNRTYYNCTIEVSEDKINWYVIYSSDINGIYEETADGYLISNFLSYNTQGEVEYIIPGTKKINSVLKSLISWKEIIPQETQCQVMLKVGSGEFLSCTNNAPLPGIFIGDDLSKQILTLKIILSTANPHLTPSISDIQIEIQTAKDKNILILYFEPGKNSIQNAVDDIQIIYNYEVLQPVYKGSRIAPFIKSFVPNNLSPKNQPNNIEHIELTDICGNAQLISIKYINTTEKEHIELSNISGTGLLKQIEYVNTDNKEHIELKNISAQGSLLSISYINTKNIEHINLNNIVAQGVLTRLEDL